jgi:hypothetical protein
MQHESHTQPSIDDRHHLHTNAKDDPPWKLALYSLAVLAFTAWFYVELSQLDSGEVESVRVWWLIAVIYNFAGKWPVVGVGAALGIGGLIYAALEYRRQRPS